MNPTKLRKATDKLVAKQEELIKRINEKLANWAESTKSDYPKIFMEVESIDPSHYDIRVYLTTGSHNITEFFENDEKDDIDLSSIKISTLKEVNAELDVIFRQYIEIADRITE